DILLLSSLRLKDKLFYGWVVVGTFFIVGITLYGIHFSFGVFFESIEGEFNLNRAGTSAVLSANLLLAGICSFFAGWALDKYGPRTIVFLMGLFAGMSLLLTSQTNSLWQLFITYSLLLSMGTGAVFVVPMSTVSRWFDKKRGTALGITSSGVGLGMFVMAPFATYLISNYNWRIAYIVIGLIAWLIVIPLSGLLKRGPYEIGTLPDGAKSDLINLKSEKHRVQPQGLSVLQASRTRSFWLIMVIWVLFGSNIFLVMTHLVPHARDIGFSQMEAATVLSIIGGIAVGGRILIGIASDRVGRKSMSVICALFQAGAMLWLIWAQELWSFYMFALVYGFAFGGMVPAMAALISDTFGLSRIGSIFGVLEIGFGVGAAIGPAIGGLIFDVSNSYVIAFSLGALVMSVVTLLIVLIKRETNRNNGGANVKS
ncbi:MFS transporter, partial [Chloroflexota bacterium]